MVLVWYRPDSASLTYLVGWGHAGYQHVRICERDDNLAVWLTGANDTNAKWHVIACLELTYGEFHNEGDFLYPNAYPTWATVVKDGDFIIEKQLTWAKDDKTGQERLIDPQRRLVWHKKPGEELWGLKSGVIPEVDFPSPIEPYEMKAPNGWKKSHRHINIPG